MIKFEPQDNAAFIIFYKNIKSQDINYIVIKRKNKSYPFEDSLQTLFPLSPRRLFPVFTFAARARLSMVRDIVESKVLALLRLLCFTPLLTLLSKLGAVLLHKEPPVLVAPPLPLIVHAPPLLLLVWLLIGKASGLSIHQLDFPVPSFCTRTKRLCRERLCLMEF